MRFALGREVAAAAAVAAGRPGTYGPGELRAHHRAEADRGSKVGPVVAQFDVTAEIGDSVAEQCPQALALAAHLPGSSRIRRNRHLHVRHGEKRVRGPARAELDDRIRLRSDGRVVYG